MIKRIVEYLKNDIGYEDKDIKVITPYRNQEALLQQALKGILDEENIGTIHKFQGSEGKVVIFSPVIFGDDSPNFINSAPNILNVAISRAKHLFIVVGNYSKLKGSGGYLRTLVEAFEKNGVVYWQSDILR